MIIQGSSRRSVSDFLIYLHLNTSNHATVDVGCNSSLQDSVSTVSAFTEIKTFILHSVSNGAMDSLKYLGTQSAALQLLHLQSPDQKYMHNNFTTK